MTPLLVDQLVRYNAWANTRTFAAASSVASDAHGQGVTRKLFDLLAHMTSTEEGYLDFLRGTSDEARLEQRRSWYRLLAGDKDKLRQRSEEIARAYREWIAVLKADDLDVRRPLGWLGVDLSGAEAVQQVVVHSIEHRSDVATVLTANGGTAPALDFVFWIKDSRP
jgi:uncharacterized damage-inducible protein DinB